MTLSKQGRPAAVLGLLAAVLATALPALPARGDGSAIRKALHGTTSFDAAALQRDLAFGRDHKINGTPGILFEDGRASPSPMLARQLNRQMALSKGADAGVSE